MSKKYNRYFLIFNEEDKGFELAHDKQPTGYTKIETRSSKCKVTVYAQNLKTDKGPYNCYLVNSSKSPAIVAKLGELSLDENGKGEVIWEYDSKNISGTGLSSDKFNVAAVVREGSRLQVPLAGYSGKDKVQWRDKITSRSFVQVEEKEEEVKEETECIKSKEEDDSLREPLGDIVESSKGDIKDEISKIVDQAQCEVIDENKELVREIKENEEEDKEIIVEDIIVERETLEEVAEVVLEENTIEESIEKRTSPEDVTTIDISDIEREIEKDIECGEIILESDEEIDVLSDDNRFEEDTKELEKCLNREYEAYMENQLKRNDDDYIEGYSDEGLKFKHYEQEINLQSEDASYAKLMAESEAELIENYNVREYKNSLECEALEFIDIPRVNKMNIFENGYKRTTECNEVLECEIEITEDSESSSVLYRAIDNINLDRNKLCKELKEDLKKLDKEIQHEIKKAVEKEINKFKEALLNKACGKHHDHEDKCDKHDYHHENHGHHLHDKYLEHKEHDSCKEHHDYPKHLQHSSCESHDHNHSYHHEQHKGHNQDKKKGYAKTLHGILKNYEEIQIENIKDCKFWKVKEADKFPNKDGHLYPYYSAIHHLKMTYPYINYIKYFKSKGHYFFGIKYDKDGEVKYIVYGIIGDKKESHQPYKGMTGFVNWTPHKESGVWLMYYNPYTGCVMLPKAKAKKKKK